MSNPDATDALVDAAMAGLDGLTDADFNAACLATSSAILVGLAASMSLPERKKLADEISARILHADMEIVQ